jgi:hypothetical protein
MGNKDKDFLDAVAVAAMIGVGFVVMMELFAAKAKRISESGEVSEMDFLEKIRREIEAKVKRR